MCRAKASQSRALELAPGRSWSGTSAAGRTRESAIQGELLERIGERLQAVAVVHRGQGDLSPLSVVQGTQRVAARVGEPAVRVLHSLARQPLQGGLRGGMGTGMATQRLRIVGRSWAGRCATRMKIAPAGGLRGL